MGSKKKCERAACRCGSWQYRENTRIIHGENTSTTLARWSLLDRKGCNSHWFVVSRQTGALSEEELFRASRDRASSRNSRIKEIKVKYPLLEPKFRSLSLPLASSFPGNRGVSTKAKLKNLWKGRLVCKQGYYEEGIKFKHRASAFRETTHERGTDSSTRKKLRLWEKNTFSYKLLFVGTKEPL